MKKAWIDKKKKPSSKGAWHRVRWIEDGKERQRSFSTPSQAREFKAIVEHRLNSGDRISATGIPWDDLVANFLEYKEKVQKRDPDTIALYRRTVLVRYSTGIFRLPFE